MLAHPKVEDDQNAFTYFYKATILMRPYDSKAISKFISDNNHDSDRIDETLNMHLEALTELRIGLKKDHYQFAVERNNGPDIETLASFKKLGILMRAQSKRALEDGDYDQSISHNSDLLRFGFLLQKGYGSLTSNLVAQAIMHMSLSQFRLIIIEPELSLSELQIISDELEKYSTVNQGIINSIKNEFHLTHTSLFSSKPFSLQNNTLVKIHASNVRHLIGSLEQPFYKIAPYKPILDLKEKHDKFGPLNQYNIFGNQVVIQTADALARFVKKGHQLNHTIALTKLLVAIRKYQIENGHYPASLADLVGTYIDTILYDFYDGKPIRYLKERKILYSVGIDLIDDTNGSRKKTIYEISDDVVYPVEKGAK